MKKLSSTILLSGLTALTFTQQSLAQSSNFSDVQGYWAEQYVTALASRTIIGGFPDGTFKPNADITRAQFAAIAVKAFNLPPSNSNSNFTDVRSNYWASPAISAVSNSGLVTGFPDGTFRPEDRITRAQALVVLTKALGNRFSPNPSKLNRYSDRQAVPDWAIDSISKAASAGIIVNFPNSSLISPNSLATRGEVAALMYQTLFRLGDRGLAPIAIGTIDSSSTTPNPDTSNLVIQRIETNATSRQVFGPGDELLVTVYGTPRANANFTLEGLNQNRPITMSEVQSGVYEGRYTIRRNDSQGTSRLRATLSKQGTGSVTRDFNQAIAINSNSGNGSISNLVIERIETNTNPRQVLTQGDEIVVTAYATPQANASFIITGINQNKPIPMRVKGNGIYEGSYTIRRNDPSVNSKVIVILSKQGSRTINKELNRQIAINSGSPANNDTLTLKPQLINFSNNAEINFPANLVGETLPNANVRVTVEALRSVVGIIDVSQNIFNGTVRANRLGRFNVPLSQNNNLSSGTRYRVRMTATDPQNNQSQSSEIFLRQR